MRICCFGCLPGSSPSLASDASKIIFATPIQVAPEAVSTQSRVSGVRAQGSQPRMLRLVALLLVGVACLLSIPGTYCADGQPPSSPWRRRGRALLAEVAIVPVFRNGRVPAADEDEASPGDTSPPEIIPQTPQIHPLRAIGRLLTKLTTVLSLVLAHLVSHLIRQVASRRRTGSYALIGLWLEMPRWPTPHYQSYGF